ncbi:MAG: phosphohydrolase [Desulfobacteraceae bacterium 4484_190.1]|nr:MAG: phosphohydrolase [Desulfobacteraceae bacterium 4484_190.1]
MVKKTVNFLFEVGMLKKTPRTGYQFLGTGKESVADHSFRTAVIGYTLAIDEPEIDTNRVVLMCLFHDFPEARTGDHNYMNKKYVKKNEEQVVRDQVRNLPFATDIESLVREFNAVKTPEAQIAKDADQIDLIMELKGQMDIGNPNAKDWLDFAIQRLVTEKGKRMVQEILVTNSNEWWFDKDTDWWITGQAKAD